MSKPSARHIIDHLQRGGNPEYPRTLDHQTLIFHNKVLADLVTGEFSAQKLREIAKTTSEARDIKTVQKHGNTFVLAADFKSNNPNFDTHYDSVWVRDTVWCYLALKLQKPEEAKQVLLSQLDYYSTQLDHVERAIKDPSLVENDKSHFNAPHIRFKARTMRDVQENGQPQPWNHKQNDALGILIDAVVDALHDQSITLEDLVPNLRAKALISLVKYLVATKFYNQEDAGPWEEANRRNTSSIALCTSALENFRKFLMKNPIFNAYCTKQNAPSDKHLQDAINKGYQIIKKQIRLGGESPDYPDGDYRKRHADAALLAVIYPAELEKLGVNYKKRVLDMVAPLAREQGIIRYAGDTYQSANFWINQLPTDLSEDIFERREEAFIEGTEAQWFFDSWFALSALKVYQQSNNHSYFQLALDHYWRGLAQATDKNYLAANGRPIDDMEFPESYNYFIYDGAKYLLPSAVCPLNWAKASQTLALYEFAKTFDINIKL